MLTKVLTKVLTDAYESVGKHEMIITAALALTHKDAWAHSCMDINTHRHIFTYKYMFAYVQAHSHMHRHTQASVPWEMYM